MSARLAAVVLCLFALSDAAFAQDKGPTAGVEIGFSSSRISPDLPGQDISRGGGLLAGGWIGFQPWVPVGIQIELLYAQKHSQIAGGNSLSLDYIEIPMLARLKLFKSIYVLEGIALGFPVSAKTTTAAGAETDTKSKVTNPDIGMIIAGGVPIAKKVNLEFRYEGGFKKISNVDTDPSQRNRSLSGVLSIRLE